MPFVLKIASFFSIPFENVCRLSTTVDQTRWNNFFLFCFKLPPPILGSLAPTHIHIKNQTHTNGHPSGTGQPQLNNTLKFSSLKNKVFWPVWSSIVCFLSTTNVNIVDLDSRSTRSNWLPIWISGIIWNPGTYIIIFLHILLENHPKS